MTIHGELKGGLLDGLNLEGVELADDRVTILILIPEAMRDSNLDSSTALMSYYIESENTPNWLNVPRAVAVETTK